MTKQTRKLHGVVVSNKMQKTVVVEVTQNKVHPKYLKQYKISKKFKAHDEAGEFKIGDKVTIAETRPLSKTKRWRVMPKVKSTEPEVPKPVAEVAE